jgi:predicted N-formylglutamate amidohydrolase
MPNLLQPGDPPPFAIENAGGASPIVFACDHAGRAVPRRLGDLGLPEDELGRHIGWDIGIFGVTTRLAKSLDAVHLYQPYSRLVIDCNRRPGHPQSIAPASDGTPVPGNRSVSSEERARRESEILHPYQRAIGRVLDEREAAGRASALFAMHSCTPQLRVNGSPRPWEIGVLADRDWRVGDALVAIFEAETDFCVGRNQPYVVNAEADYTVPVHGEERGLPYAEIEIRQDLIETEDGQERWAALLAGIFPRAVERSGALRS